MILFEGKRLLVASHNDGKVREIRALVEPLGFEAVPAADLDVPEPEETGLTFAENAELKARHAAELTGLPALADDSGLAVDALGGEPGIYSARWAGEPRDFGRAMERVEAELQAKGAIQPPQRTAKFVCCLCLAQPKGGRVFLFQGEAPGRLIWPPRGDKGFGYDPMFLPDARGETYGEMDQDEKHLISHRADAFAKFVAAMEAG